MPPPTLGQRFSYEIDRLLSWSPAARFLILGLISFVLILLCAVLITFVEPMPLHSALWWALIRVIDTAAFGDEETGASALVAFISALCGMMVVASLIGLVSSTLQEQFEELRKGKSKVIDEDHTLILGFEEEKVRVIIQELELRAASHREKHSVVLLSEQEKEDIETTIADNFNVNGRVRIVVRKGSPFNPTDLEKCNAGTARSIVVLNPNLRNRDEDESEHTADMPPIKALLALAQVPQALKGNHAVLELFDQERIPVLEHIAGVGRARAVVMSETLARIMVQTSRVPGLAEVYADLLTFEGNEFYFHNVPEFEGIEFGQVQSRVYHAVVCGFDRPDGPRNSGLRKVFLNPAANTKLQVDDRLILIAPCENIPHSFRVGKARALDWPQLASRKANSRLAATAPERFVVCGFSKKLPFMLEEFESYVEEGSEVALIPGIAEEDFWQAIDKARFKKLRLTYLAGDPTLPAPLRPIAALHPVPRCIMVLADDTVNEAEADAKTIITVLLLHKMMNDTFRARLTCEILDQKSTRLLDRNVGCEFVLSTHLTCRLLTQVANAACLSEAFSELFSPEGNEIYLKDAAFYSFGHGKPTPWLATQTIASSVNEVAVGYFKNKSVLNPPQDELITYQPGDRIIVIADDGREYSDS